VPASAVANVTSGAPPYADSQASGDSAWANASRPQGKPPNGPRSRAASCATHSAAAHSGQPGSRAVTASPAPSAATKAASAAARINHGSGPT
jgi:hypothetical protein